MDENESTYQERQDRQEGPGLCSTDPCPDECYENGEAGRFDEEDWSDEDDWPEVDPEPESEDEPRRKHWPLRVLIALLCVVVLCMGTWAVCFFVFAHDIVFEANAWIFNQQIGREYQEALDETGEEAPYLDRYYYQQLDAEQQEVYELVYQAAWLEKEGVYILGHDGTEVSEIFWMLWFDSPELFYVYGWGPVETYAIEAEVGERSSESVTLGFVYMDEFADDVGAARERFEAATDEALAEIDAALEADALEAGAVDGGDAATWTGEGDGDGTAAGETDEAGEGGGFIARASDEEKVRAIDAWLVENLVYDYDTLERLEINNSEQMVGETAYGALVDGSCICGGYATAFEYLCRACGVGAIVILGEANNTMSTGTHAWNGVLVDGVWLCADITWDDAIGTDGVAYPTDAYLMITGDEMGDFGHASDNGFPVDPPEECCSVDTSMWVSGGWY